MCVCTALILVVQTMCMCMWVMKLIFMCGGYVQGDVEKSFRCKHMGILKRVNFLFLKK